MKTSIGIFLAIATGSLMLAIAAAHAQDKAVTWGIDGIAGLTSCSARRGELRIVESSRSRRLLSGMGVVQCNVTAIAREVVEKSGCFTVSEKASSIMTVEVTFFGFDFSGGDRAA